MLDREKVGRAVSEQRKIKGMTQKQLADLLNVSYQAVSRWEQGISLPSVDMIYDIAQVLDTTVDFLLNGLSEERKTISYIDTGLDAKKLHIVKDKLSRLITPDDRLIHTNVADPVFFKPDLSGMEEPVCVLANHVPGSKERFAMENGYDREICMDLVSTAANNLIRFGVKPSILLVNIVCGNNDSGQILFMGEAFKEACEDSGIIFAGLEVAAQAVNYGADEYKIGALVMGNSDRKEIITGDRIAEGDVLIALHTEGISSLSYPFVKVILDRRPDIAYEKIDGEKVFMDELMKPNTSYVNVVCELNRQNLIHGVFVISKSLFNRKCYDTMPKGLGAGISLDRIPMPALFQYLYDLNMMDRECFLEDFSLGIGMLLAVPREQCDRAVKIIEQYHSCECIGRIEKDGEHPDARVWLM
ncbi:MAG: helix-turn-helix domain-containing protein [Lachnospiraceae bacterium]|nr:helix-turn-helix domain-containing protein [Lachnospiraceae bacterium]